MITPPATLGIGFYHRIFGDSGPKACDGHGTSADATHTRDSAAEMDTATESPGDGSKRTAIHVTLYFPMLYFASGDGRIWNFTTFGIVPFPPS